MCNYSGKSVGPRPALACTRTLASASAEPWWEVDLGAPTEVSDVVVWGCADCSDPLRDVCVLVGDEACVMASPSRRVSVAHCGGVRGSNVRVELREGNAPLVLCEVEVHGLAPRRRKGVGADAESRHYAKDGRVLTVKAGAPPVVALGTTLYLSGATSAVTAVLVLGRSAWTLHRREACRRGGFARVLHASTWGFGLDLGRRWRRFRAPEGQERDRAARKRGPRARRARRHRLAPSN